MGKIRFNKSIRSLFVFVVAASLVIGVSIHAALAYFTTYCMAEGGLPIEYGTTTIIDEEMYEGMKIVSLRNSSDSKEPVYVRVKAFAGEEFQPLSYDGGDYWVEGPDKFWYFVGNPENDVLGYLNPGDDTNDYKLTIKIERLRSSEGYELGDQIEIPVVYESTPVQYDANWNPISALDANWDKLPQTESNTEGGE